MTPAGVRMLSGMTSHDAEPTRADTLRAELADFADTLEAAGFRVYRPGRTWTFLGFAREVDGAWCSATVEASRYGDGHRWLTNIVPSHTDGSSAFLEDVPDGSPLTVETATAITVPTARNIVLSQARPNAGWPSHWRDNRRPT